MLASLDVGTNSVLLTIAAVEKGGTLRVVEQQATVTRLGQGVDKTGQLHPDAKKRTLDCLREYKVRLLHHGVAQAAAVGTSALRDAQGGLEFCSDAGSILGFPLEIISGQREAELTFRGALLDLPLKNDAFVFDIGGGSTELISGQTHPINIFRCLSLDIGSVRLTERHKLSDPPTEAQLVALRSAIGVQLARFPAPQQPNTETVGVAGTVTTLAAIGAQIHPYDSDKIHGMRLFSNDILALSEKLFFMTVEERLRLPGLTKGRADVIGAGAILCSEILSHVGASQLIVSDRGVRFGLLQELAAQTC